MILDYVNKMSSLSLSFIEIYKSKKKQKNNTKESTYTEERTFIRKKNTVIILKKNIYILKKYREKYLHPSIKQSTQTHMIAEHFD